MLGLLKTSLVLGAQTVYGKAKLRIMSQLVSMPVLRAPTPFVFGLHSVQSTLQSCGVTAMGHSGTIAHTLAIDVSSSVTGQLSKQMPTISADAQIAV